MKSDVQYNLDERYVFSDKAKKNIFIVLIIGIIFFAIGVAMLAFGDAGGGAHALAYGDPQGHVEGGHGGFSWVTRLKTDLWINTVFFVGITMIGVFFVAIQSAAHVGWSAALKRVPEAFGSFLPVLGVIMVILFFWAGHDIFHWTHHSLFEEFMPDGVTKNPEYDEIIAGKAGFLNPTFFYVTLGFVFVWFAFWYFIRKNSLAEDLEGGTERFWKIKTLATLFIIFLAISSSIAAWMWVMSIDTHWFSTMFGWYMFASWHVSGLATITLTVLFLKDQGYLKMINENHLHDLGKFIFAFSIFWSYVWFAQFLLIYYANIPEETAYFIDRFQNDLYRKAFFLNIFLNFIFPFFGLMTRDAKRKTILLKIVCFGVLAGHWIDFYQMITPGVLKENGGFGFMELGLIMIYVGVFALWIGNALSKAPLVAKNHPMLQESLNHHI